MRNIAFVVSYLGTAYHGWQFQKNAITIQEILQTAVQKATGFLPSISGCGRTDARVHARAYVANAFIDTKIPIEKLQRAINAYLPADISVSRALVMHDEFDARFSCVRKEYTYHICNSRTRDPFMHDRAYFYPVKLDCEQMSRAAAHFVGTHDFAAVKSEGTPVKSTVRTIYYCECLQNGQDISIRVCADGFLYNMVRAIAGTLIYCGIGKICADDIPQILANADRTAAGPTAPPEGLYMTALDYNELELNRLVPDCGI